MWRITSVNHNLGCGWCNNNKYRWITKTISHSISSERNIATDNLSFCAIKVWTWHDIWHAIYERFNLIKLSYKTIAKVVFDHRLKNFKCCWKRHRCSFENTASICGQRNAWSKRSEKCIWKGYNWSSGKSIF